jgi:DNA-binding beta-propeller fold protein YncE
MAIDSAGQYLYVIDDQAYLSRVEISSGSITNMASGWSDSPLGTALSEDGTKAYVSTHGPNVCGVYEVDLASGSKTVIAGTGGPGHVDGPGSSAMFSYPRSIFRIGTNLYVADSYNYCIRRIDLSSTDYQVYSDVAGSCGVGSGSGTTDGVGSDARFNHPEGLGSSPDGNILYVGDTSGNRLRAIELSTRTVTTITSSNLNNPWSVTTSADGSMIYVADRNSNQVDMIEASTGSTITSWSGFSTPYGLVARKPDRGVVYVAASRSVYSLVVA